MAVFTKICYDWWLFWVLINNDWENDTMSNTFETPTLIGLLSDASDWRLHNCKFLQTVASFDEPMSLLNHYDSLSDELKADRPLSFELLKRMNEPMTAQMADELLDLPMGTIKAAWHIKYVGRTVFFCDSWQLAVRVQFSNTSKNGVAVYGLDKASAWQSQADTWRFFGVVDILYKGADKLAIDESYVIEKQDNYQSLPATQSLAVIEWLNEQKLDNAPNLAWLWTALGERVGVVLPSD